MHKAKIREAFAGQASHFGEQGLTLSSPEILSWIIDGLPCQPAMVVLDVAAGTGLRPFIDDGILKFLQTWAIIIGHRE
jgi:protein-L-isoaspartate O-methyltransferase